MDPTEKNKISHRRRALNELRNYFSNPIGRNILIELDVETKDN